MLAELLVTPTRAPLADPRPIVCTAWMGKAIDVRGLQRIQISAGLWIWRVKRWQSTAALDIAELLPDPRIGVEPLKIRIDRPSWGPMGICAKAGIDDPKFFGVDDIERPALSPSAVQGARAMCRACPVNRACLLWALTEDERFGIWGGTTGRQRRYMRAQLAAGVPLGKLVNAWLTRMIRRV